MSEIHLGLSQLDFTVASADPGPSRNTHYPDAGKKEAREVDEIAQA
jgi:hypothetical protein